MYILGIDPGSRTTGYGIVAANAGKITYVTSGCIKLVGSDMPPRLRQLYDAMLQLSSQFKIDTCVIESVFVRNNVSSALKLGQARGVLLLFAAKLTDKIYEYSPREVKQAVVGYGGAEKTQVQTMVKSILSLSSMPQEDAADALAIAICHANTIAWRSKVRT